MPGRRRRVNAAWGAESLGCSQLSQHGVCIVSIYNNRQVCLPWIRVCETCGLVPERYRLLRSLTPSPQPAFAGPGHVLPRGRCQSMRPPPLPDSSPPVPPTCVTSVTPGDGREGRSLPWNRPATSATWVVVARVWHSGQKRRPIPREYTGLLHLTHAPTMLLGAFGATALFPIRTVARTRKLLYCRE